MQQSFNFNQTSVSFNFLILSNKWKIYYNTNLPEEIKSTELKHEFNCIPCTKKKKKKWMSEKQKYNETFQIFLSTFFLRRNNEKQELYVKCI